jgi:hypothetical protein
LQELIYPLRLVRDASSGSNNMAVSETHEVGAPLDING